MMMIIIIIMMMIIIIIIIIMIIMSLPALCVEGECSNYTISSVIMFLRPKI